MGNTQFISFDVEIKREDIEVQHLAQKFFETFASVLVSNDWIVRCAVKTLSAIRISWTAAKPVLEATNTVVTAILSHIAPMRLRAVRQARWYSERADSLKECTQY